MVSKAFNRRSYRRQLSEVAAAPEVDELTLVAAPGWIDAGRLQPFEPSDDDGFEVRIAPVRFNGNFHVYYWHGLGRILREKQPHLVHIDEEPPSLAAFLAARLARQVGARSVFFSWENIFKRYPPPFGLFERYVHSYTRGALAGNRDAQGVLRRKGYRHDISIVPQVGVDADLFTPRERRAAGPPSVGYVGRLVSQKGVHVLIEAFSAVPPPSRLHVIGSGPFERALHDRAVRLGILDRISWQPDLPSREVPERLNGLDLLVLPSLTTPTWREQFGRVLVEAMACGVPVVGSDSGEIPHVLQGVGAVTPEGDSISLAATLRRLLADPAERERMARAGRARVLDQYTQGRVARQTVAAYVRACAVC